MRMLDIVLASTELYNTKIGTIQRILAICPCVRLTCKILKRFTFFATSHPQRTALRLFFKLPTYDTHIGRYRLCNVRLHWIIFYVFG